MNRAAEPSPAHYFLLSLITTGPFFYEEIIHRFGNRAEYLFVRYSICKTKIMAAESEKLMGVRQQVKEVSDVARSNIQKVMDRGDRLDDLQARAGKHLHV
ncbi:hypothetical protein EMCRGX_G016974 [Ephydatia muelleri]